MGGGLAALGGTTILYGLKKVTDQAKDLSHELNGVRGHRRPPYRPLEHSRLPLPRPPFGYRFFAKREPGKVFRDLAETPGVEIRVKHETSAPMLLRSYQIDGRLLRTAPRTFPHPGSSVRIMI
jgi:hypothetical protein